jgi:amino acid permease
VLIGIASISFFGIALYGDAAMDEPRILPLWCPSASDFATFVGVAIFGFGTCSLAFPVEETMKVPLDFPIAAKYSLIFVWIVYCFVGNGIASLFIHDSRGINSNILRNLPTDALSAHVVKVALAGSCLLTLPLAFIPPAQMIEQKLMHHFEFSNGESHHGTETNAYKTLKATGAGERTPISQSPSYHVSRSGSPVRRSNYGGNDEDLESDDPLYRQEPSWLLRVMNRVVLMVIITTGSLAIPCFGLMVSFLGSFTVAILSFVLPPLFSMLIITKRKKDKSSADKWNYIRDLVLLAVGIFTAVSATVIVALKCFETMTNGEGEC